jgi:hypothetical protein
MTIRFRLISAVLWTVVILILCWTPQVWLPVEEVPESWGRYIPLDKIVHLGIFAVFGVLWLRALPVGSNRFLWVGLGGTALAAITEIVQNVPILHRDGEFQDAAADVVGMLLGFLVYPWIERTLNTRRWLGTRIIVSDFAETPRSRLPSAEDHSP